MATLSPARIALKRPKRDYPIAIGLAIIHLGALGVFVPALFSWSAVAVAVGLYIVTGMGITLAFHRLLTHRSLVVPRPVEYALTIIGTLSASRRSGRMGRAASRTPCTFRSRW